MPYPRPFYPSILILLNLYLPLSLSVCIAFIISSSFPASISHSSVCLLLHFFIPHFSPSPSPSKVHITLVSSFAHPLLPYHHSFFIHQFVSSSDIHYHSPPPPFSFILQSPPSPFLVRITFILHSHTLPFFFLIITRFSFNSSSLHLASITTLPFFTSHSYHRISHSTHAASISSQETLS